MENGAVVSSSINKAKLKREKLMKNAQHYKNVLRTWEAAVSKAEGRIPGKNDLKTAPESVQKAYKEFYKLKRYLEGSSSSTSRKFLDNSISGSKGPSPSKIFFGRNIGRVGNSPIKSPTSKPSKSKKSGILKTPSSHPSKNSAGCSFNVFKEKMSFAVNFLGKKSPAKMVRKEVFDSDAGELVARKVLIPNRFSNTLRSSSNCQDESSNIGQQSGIPSDMEQDHNHHSMIKESSFLDEADHIAPSAALDVVSKNLANDNECNESSHTIGKRNSVSAIWHSFSPKSKNLNATKHVDSQWLRRCRNVSQMSDDDQQNSNNDFRENESKECESDDDDKQDSDKCEISDAASSQQLFARSFEDFLMSAASSPEEKEAPILPPTNINTITPATNDNCYNNNQITLQPDEEMFDSGLGMSSSFLFSAQEIMDVITNEVLPETTTLPTDKDNIHNENACSPSENNFQTIDMSVIGNFISANPFASAISPCSPRASAISADKTESENLRKRKALFSPSPKKLSPKKKFFKSSRIKAKYGIQSYKPPTPSKKKNATNAAAALKNNNITKHADKYKESTITLGLVDITSTKTSSAKSNQVEDSETPTTSVEPTSSKNLDKVEYFDEAAQDAYASGRQNRNTKRRKLSSGVPSLATRIRRSKPNENFVKIDITKKVFVRGHKKISGSKVKRNDWKMKKAASSKEDKLKSLVCRKCGESGHFRKFCMKDIIPVEEPQYIDDSPFPSLQEAALMVKTNGGIIPVNHVNIYSNSKVQDTSQELVELSPTVHDISPITLSLDEDQPISHSCANKPILPYFASEHDLTQDVEDEILNDTIRKFGYENFRPRQKEAVSRILKGLSTLCVLSTGSGKSLCYQLPAFLYAEKNPGALAICVSPLVSLMEDQVQGIPPFLHAAFLHSNMISSHKEKVLEKIRSKKLHILLVSPEAVCGGLFGILRGNDLPQISFACIDEVHCVSQWSHNFRPCYLQLAKILREKLHVRTILGLTATATEHTANSICQTLQIDPSMTIRGEIIPVNLHLSASRDSYRDEALLTLLQGERFSTCESIIIYCTRRDECQRISALIRTSIQDPNSKNAGVSKINSRQRVSTTCEAYHAGMSAGKRRLVQQQFMSGNIRIVVATVAFGMGIDKSNIRAVIHYNMPKTFESYVQEIGRAGRDGEPAHCHLFLDNVKGRDLNELKRHVYSNSIDRATLRKLLRKIFQSCKCGRIADFSHKGSTSHKNTPKGRCPGHEVSFSIEETVHELDLPQENISTILCYLELDYSRKWIEMLPHTYQTCKIHSYGGASLLKSSALKCPPLAAAIALKKESKKFKDADVYLEFDVIEVSATLGWNSGAVKKELKNLEWTSTSCGADGNTKFRKSGILVEFCNLAFHVNAPGDLTDEEADSVLDYLHNHNQEQEKTQLYQLHKVYQALMGISNSTVENICEKSDEEKSNLLKKFIHTYFLQKTPGVPPEWKNEVTYPEHQEQEVRSNIINLLASVKDAQFTGRSVARIFQGIPSPCFPVEDWARNRSFWRKHIEYDFHYLCKIASQEILRF